MNQETKPLLSEHITTESSASIPMNDTSDFKSADQVDTSSTKPEIRDLTYEDTGDEDSGSDGESTFGLGDLGGYGDLMASKLFEALRETCTTGQSKADGQAVETKQEHKVDNPPIETPPAQSESSADDRPTPNLVENQPKEVDLVTLLSLLQQSIEGGDVLAAYIEFISIVLTAMYSETGPQRMHPTVPPFGMQTQETSVDLHSERGPQRMPNGENSQAMITTVLGAIDLLSSKPAVQQFVSHLAQLPEAVNNARVQLNEENMQAIISACLGLCRSIESAISAMQNGDIYMRNMLHTIWQFYLSTALDSSAMDTFLAKCTLLPSHPFVKQLGSSLTAVVQPVSSLVAAMLNLHFQSVTNTFLALPTAVGALMKGDLSTFWVTWNEFINNPDVRQLLSWIGAAVSDLFTFASSLFDTRRTGTTNGRQSSPPTDGVRRSPPTDGKQSDLPSDGKQSDPPTDGKQSDPPMDGKQSSDNSLDMSLPAALNAAGFTDIRLVTDATASRAAKAAITAALKAAGYTVTSTTPLFTATLPDPKNFEEKTESNVAARLSRWSDQYQQAKMNALFKEILPWIESIACKGHQHVHCRIVSSASRELAEVAMQCVKDHQYSAENPAPLTVTKTFTYRRDDLSFMFSEPDKFQQFFLDQGFQTTASITRVLSGSKFISMWMELKVSWSKQADGVPTMKPVKVKYYNLAGTRKPLSGLTS